MIETWVNIIETLICIHIIQKIKEIIPEEVEKDKSNKIVETGLDIAGGISKLISQTEESKETLSESYEILEHKYYEKMQQLVVKLKEEQSQLQYKLGSIQDAYKFKLDIDLEATQYKMPKTRESLLSLNDIFTKAKRVINKDNLKWKNNVVIFINKHFMNDLVDNIVTRSNYKSSNVMTTIQEQIQLKFLNNTNIDDNFFNFTNKKEPEWEQYDDKMKTGFTKYYHNFFLENLNGKINNKPLKEGLKELQNLLKEFQKLQDPEFYGEEKEAEKEILKKIDMGYGTNLNLMRDFVEDNMKTKFETFVKSNIEIKDSSVELKREKVIKQIEKLILDNNNTIKEQKDKVENEGKEIDKRLEALQRENVENNKKIKEMEEENNRLKAEKVKTNEDSISKQRKLEVENLNLSSDLFNKIQQNKKQIDELRKQEEENKIQKEQIIEQNTKLEAMEVDYKTNVENLKAEYQKNVEKLKTQYVEELETEEKRNTNSLNEAADKLEKEYKEELNELQNKHLSELNSLQIQMKNLNSDNENLRNTLTQKDNDINNLTEINNSLGNLSNNNAEKVTELNRRNIELMANLKTMDEEKNNMRTTNDDYILQLQNKNNELQEKIDNLEKRKEKIEMNLNEAQDKLKVKEEENNELQQQQIKVETKLKIKENENIKLQENIERQEKEFNRKTKDLENKNNALTEDNIQKKEQIQQQREEIDVQQQTIINLRNQIQNNNTEIEAFKSSINLLRTRINKQTNEINELNDSITKLALEKDQVEEKKKQFETKLNAIKTKEEEEEKAKNEEKQREEAVGIIQKKYLDYTNSPKYVLKKLKKEAINNINKFIDETNKFINLIKKISLIDKSGNKSINIDTITYGFSDNDNAKMIKNNKDIGEKNINELNNYLIVFTFIKDFIEKYIINKDELVDSEYSLYNDIHHSQYVRINKNNDGTYRNIVFPNLPPKEIKKISYDTIRTCEFYKNLPHSSKKDNNILKLLIDDCKLEYIFGENVSYEENKYIKLFTSTKKSIKTYFEKALNLNDAIIFEQKKANKTNSSNKNNNFKQKLEVSIEITSNNITDAVGEANNKLNHFIGQFNVENDTGLLFYKNGKGNNELNNNVKHSYKVIQNFANKFCNGNGNLVLSSINSLYPTNKENATKFDKNLEYKRINKSNNYNRSKKQTKEPCGPEFEEAIKKILIKFNDAFSKENNSEEKENAQNIIKFTTPTKQNDPQSPETEKVIYKSSNNPDTKTVDDNNNKHTSHVGYENDRVSPLQQKALSFGGKHKTRRKGRNNKKTKTRKK